MVDMAHTVQRFKVEQNSPRAVCPQLPTATTVSLPKVKSVLAATNQHTPSSKPMTHPLSEPNTTLTRANPDKDGVSQSDKGVSNAGSKRLVIFKGDLDWEHEKCQYVHLVTRHMNENRGDRDTMTELLNLMTHVADRTTGSNCRQWQHPSDLTRRNYQRRFGNSLAKITLSEWQAQNHNSYQRFGMLSKVTSQQHLLQRDGEKEGKDVADPGIHDHITGAHDTDSISLCTQCSEPPKQWKGDPSLDLDPNVLHSTS